MKKLDKPNNTKDYESYLKMLRQAQPTQQDMKIGYRVFYTVIVFSIPLMIHIAMTTEKYFLLNWWFHLMCIVLFLGFFYIIPWIRYVYSIHYFGSPLVITPHEGYTKYNFINSSVASWVICIKLCRLNNKKWLLVPPILFFTTYVICLVFVAIYESTGFYIDITSYINILDIMPTVWDDSGGNINSEPYIFVNTLYVFLYYMMQYIIFPMYIITGIYGIVYVAKDVKIFLKNTDYVKDRVQEIRQNSKQNSKNMMYYGSIKFIIFTLLFILFAIVGFFDAFNDGEDFYKSFYNSTYTILDVLIMFAGAFFCLSIILFQFKWWIMKFYFLQIDELRNEIKIKKRK